MSDITHERFLPDVADHAMTIELDNGLHRSLHFGERGSSCKHFRINTFPGHLCYSGDMSTFVFSRLRDMFEFFRSEELWINPGYWAGKLVAVEKDGGYKEYDHNSMVEVVNRDIDDWDFGDHPWLRGEARTAANRLLEEISGCRTTETPIAKMMECRPKGAEDIFDELWDYGFTRPTYSFEWCLYAIVWGIQQYDTAKAIEAAA